jgi:hypothetical protein
MESGRARSRPPKAVKRALALPLAFFAVGLTAAAYAALAGASALDVVITPVPVPVFGLSPQVFLPLIAAPELETLPPGSVLPTDEQCAARVQHRAENKRMNAAYNATTGLQQLGQDFFGGSDRRANTVIAARVTGNFTGTTDEVLQWVACKWGIDADIVRAQAAIESWWRQDAKGDWSTDAGRCPSGHGLGVDGHPGLCPESWGLLQARYPYHQSAWSGMADSSAFNVDTAYAVWRACYEGYELWLNQVERGKEYGPGDVWGCVGRWYAGRWHTPEAENYIGWVKDYLDRRIWEQAYFQEP